MKTPNPAKISKTTITCGSSAEIVGSIGDLLIQIFVHLPLKPLFRFKIVSKHWNSITSDPRFQLLHSQVHNKNRAVGLIFQKIYPPLVETRVISFDTTTNRLPPQIMVLPDQTLRIFHSCNGLLVFKSTLGPEKQYYYVYNPTIKQISAPLLKDDIINARPQDRVVGMYLAFDPTKSPHYKVVCVWELSWFTSVFHQYQFEVYSPETGSWETRGGYNTKTGNVNFENNGVYWNGAIHWFNLFGKSVYFNPDHDDEMPRVMPAAPPDPLFDSPRYYFGESCDHLHCALYSFPRVCVYEMRRDYSEWFLKYKVDYYSQYLRNRYTVRKLCSVVRGNKDEDSFLVFGTDKGEMMRYNLVHNTFQTMQVKDLDFQKNDFISYLCIESPCSV